VQREVSHLFPCHTRRRVDIVITRDNFCTLANVIVDPTPIYLVQCVLMTTSHVAIIATQDKAQSYIKRTPREDFIPLATETYNCLHPHFDSFLTSCVHACITHHQQTSLVLLMFISHCKQQVSIALQHVQAITIFRQAITFSHSFTSLPHILASAPPSLVDLWHRMPF
jgi:hypothetical protein